MDDAEILADQIIIMSQGDIVCNASSNFLKQKWSTGYILSVDLVPNAQVLNYINSIQIVFDHIKKHIKDAFMIRSKDQNDTNFEICIPFLERQK